ncbi:hypothetical protein QE152_g38817 [Popillia japonica]|uniref:Uncharacterized protein n=1 Tax=Popillia japonica TaxID=7064 RepID=A0AAW1HVX9_POPJA
MNLQNLVLSQKPSNWQLYNGSYDANVPIPNDSEEFIQVNELISTSQEFSNKTTGILLTITCNLLFCTTFHTNITTSITNCT